MTSNVQRLSKPIQITRQQAFRSHNTTRHISNIPSNIHFFIIEITYKYRLKSSRPTDALCLRHLKWQRVKLWYHSKHLCSFWASEPVLVWQVSSFRVHHQLIPLRRQIGYCGCYGAKWSRVTHRRWIQQIDPLLPFH